MRLILVIAFACQPIFAQTKPAPNWTLKDINGRQIRFQDYQGKVVLLNFWATWCAPCLAEIPQLKRWQRRYSKAGLQIIGITYPPQTKREISSFVRKRKITYPIILGTTENKSYFTTSETLPFTIVLDRKGNIHAMIEGILFEEEFVEKVQPLLLKK